MAIELCTIGGGCFWCLEAPLSKLQGVESVLSGYSDGEITNPSYEQICTDSTGHAEVVQITFDSELISYQTLLEVFFALHDPTTLNRQGADTGTQYRSIILYHNAAQQQSAEEFIAQLQQSELWSDPVVTEIKPLDIFYPAEDYHQNYFQLNPDNRYCQAVISPKLAKLQHSFREILK